MAQSQEATGLLRETSTEPATQRTSCQKGVKIQTSQQLVHECSQCAHEADDDDVFCAFIKESDAAHSSVFSKIIQTEKRNKILQNLSNSPTKVTIGSVRWFIYKQFIYLIGSQ